MVRILVLLLVLLAGCAGVRPGGEAPLRLHDVELATDTVWQGRILIDGRVKLDKGATLTIQPGTEVAFVRRDRDQDGLGDGTLVVEGNLVAVGTPLAPICFKSAAVDPRPGDWLEIRADFAREVHLRYCEIRDSAYTLHAHFTRGLVEDCTIHHNIDGCRLGQARFELRHNLIADNQGKGVNFRNSQVNLHHNIIRNNGAGIFLFECDRPFIINANNIFANRFNFRLGDFYRDDVSLAGNWWGSADPGVIASGIFDRRRDADIGRVSLEPATSWIADCGPSDPLRLEQAWSLATDGFVDSPALVSGGTLFVAGWDGALRAVTPDGRRRWQAPLGDVTDAALATDGKHLFVQSWNRRVQARSCADGAPIWQFDYPASGDDDHRQGGLVLAAGRLLVPAWNGTLYALDPASGRPLWQVDCGQPLRAAPAVVDGRIYQVSGSGRISALTPEGGMRWQRDLRVPLLSTPAASGDRLFVLAKDGELIALAQADGRELWRTPLTGPAFYAAPVIGPGALFAATAGGFLYRLDPETGAIVWRQATPGPVYATPALYRRRLLIGDNSGQLTVFGSESGSFLASLDVGGPIQATPVGYAGFMVFGARDQALHAVRLAPAVEVRP